MSFCLPDLFPFIFELATFFFFFRPVVFFETLQRKFLLKILFLIY